MHSKRISLFSPLAMIYSVSITVHFVSLTFRLLTRTTATKINNVIELLRVNRNLFLFHLQLVNDWNWVND